MAQPSGGLHLVTRMVVDDLGRTVSTTDPNPNTTYVVYNDANLETRTYPGWQTATSTTTGPTQVVRKDLSGYYSETLTMSATPHVIGGASS